jgi:hypothetical protein
MALLPLGQKNPGKQVMQNIAPALEYLPASQAVHVAAEMAAGRLEEYPAGH